MSRRGDVLPLSKRKVLDPGNGNGHAELLERYCGYGADVGWLEDCHLLHAEEEIGEYVGLAVGERGTNLNMEKGTGEITKD